MRLLNLLANNERIIVYSFVTENTIYTWNQSDTLQCWTPRSFSLDDWEELNILTQSGYGPKTFDEARAVAIAWHTNSL